MSEIELLPCPHCEDGKTVLHTNELTDKYHVTCCDCGCRTADFKHPEEAIEKWNTRKPMERINAIFKERLEKYLGEAKMQKHNRFYNIAKQYEARAYPYIEAMHLVKEVGGIE